MNCHVGTLKVVPRAFQAARRNRLTSEICAGRQVIQICGQHVCCAHHGEISSKGHGRDAISCFMALWSSSSTALSQIRREPQVLRVATSAKALKISSLCALRRGIACKYALRVSPDIQSLALTSSSLPPTSAASGSVEACGNS